MGSMHGDQGSRPGSGSFGSGMVRIDSADDPQVLLSYLDDVAEVPAVQKVKEAATEALSLNPGDRVLDVGCGTGVDAPGMAAAVLPGGALVGIDISELAVEHASRRMASVPEAQILVADAHELPFAADSFEACRVDRTMLHLDVPEQALAEIRRVLVPGGRLAVLESGSALEGDAAVVSAPVQQMVATRYWRPHETVAQITLFLPLLMSRAGYEDIRTERLTSRNAEFEVADRLLRLREGADEAVRAGKVVREEAGAWLGEVEAGMKSGDVWLQTEGLLFRARSPA